MIPSENHQESHQSVPTGPSAIIERQEAHEELFDGSTGFGCVVMKLNHAQRAIKQGYEADTYLSSDYTVVTTSTMNGHELLDWGWEKERDVVRGFNPDFHIPVDYPVYRDHSVAVREQNIRDCVEGTAWMKDQLSDIETRILPLLKGVSAAEREIFYRAFERMGFDGCALYGTQYFTQGPNFSALNDDLHTVSSEAPELDVFLIGLLAPDYVEKLPSNVVGVAGLQKWRRTVQLRDDDVDINEMRRRARRLASNVEDALSEGQAPLDLWTERVETEVRN